LVVYGLKFLQFVIPVKTEIQTMITF